MKICVYGYIRTQFEISSIPKEIIHLLLLFYAKPFTFRCRWNSNMSHIHMSSDDITYCAVSDNWDSMLLKIANLNEYQFKISNMITIPSVRNIYVQCGFKQITNSLTDEQELLCSVEN